MKLWVYDSTISLSTEGSQIITGFCKNVYFSLECLYFSIKRGASYRAYADACCRLQAHRGGQAIPHVSAPTLYHKPVAEGICNEMTRERKRHHSSNLTSFIGLHTFFLCTFWFVAGMVHMLYKTNRMERDGAVWV